MTMTRMWQSMDDRLWGSAEVAEYLGVPVQTLYVWRVEGRAPRGFKVGKHLRYRRADVDAWLVERETNSGRAAT
jgi:excisionase family DNA binding protein